MGLGTYFFGIIGAFVRWIFKGFEGTIKETWEGPKYEDRADSAMYEIINNVIGMATIGVIVIIVWYFDSIFRN